MKTYQDLLNIGENLINKGTFCIEAIAEFKTSQIYQKAKAGESYYNKHNLTIEKYQKFLYTLSGNQIPDIFSSNYKLKTLFFRRLVTQQIQYVLGKGVNFQNKDTLSKLGADFDFRLQEACKLAMSCGQSFGFWNLDHLEIFGFVDTDTHAGFCPLYNEETAELMGGIRYWHKYIGDKLTTHFTLYEPDGYTQYVRFDSKPVEVVEDKKSYVNVVVSTAADGVEAVIGQNYETLPIIPLYANDAHETELEGIRECIDCYDFIKSGLANDIDDTSGFYWVLKNSGGMDDKDLAQFVQRMHTVRAATASADDIEVEAHTLDIPTNARQAMLELLRSDIYEDFQALDVKSLSAAAKTTQEIQAAYQAQDNKCADFEYYVKHFIRHILQLAGIDDEPSFVWNRVVNQAEQTSMILSCANYLSEECIIKHLPFLTPEESLEEIKQYNNRAFDQFNGTETGDSE